MFSKVSKAKKWLIGIGAGCLSVTMCATGCVLGLRNKANAITNNDTTSYVKVGEIWDGNEFKAGNLNKLLQYVSGNASASTKDLSSVTSTTKTSAQMRSNSVGDKASGKDIIVTFGGLDWEVVYLSPDKSSDPVLTLWLSNSTQSAWSSRSSTEGELYGYLNGGLYSDWAGDWDNSSTTVDYPSAMYGTSYMRSVTLNNGGMYTYGNGNTTAYQTTTASKSSSSAFAKFTMDSVEGNVTQFLTKPRQMSWQESGQSAKTQMAKSYNYPNENWSNSVSDDGFYSSSYNYAHKTGNDTWADDYLWLPSLTETGYDATHIGIWSTSTEQRANYDGTTTAPTGAVGSNNQSNGTSVSVYSWLRSGDTVMASTAYTLYPSGAYSTNFYVTYSRAVRPALHLNLKKAAEAAGKETWLDHADTTWEGDGLTEETAYIIDTPEKLAGLSLKVKQQEAYSGKYFKQTVNISLGGYSWTPIGAKSGDPFAGCYDGGGYTISGMVAETVETYCGLFGTSYGTIKNINIKDSMILGGDYTGAVAGYASVENCHVFSTVVDGNKCAGGLTGLSGSEVKESSFSGYVKGTTYVGGIVGTGGNIKNCISNAILEGATVGSISGKGSGTISNCFGQGLINGKLEDVIGGLVGELQGTLVNCCFIGKTIPSVNLVGSKAKSAVIDSCYASVNEQKFFSDGDFSGWSVCGEMNEGLPIQKVLYYVAQFGNSVSASWFAENGFNKV